MRKEKDPIQCQECSLRVSGTVPEIMNCPTFIDWTNEKMPSCSSRLEEGAGNLEHYIDGRGHQTDPSGRETHTNSNDYLFENENYQGL